MTPSFILFTAKLQNPFPLLPGAGGGGWAFISTAGIFCVRFMSFNCFILNRKFEVYPTLLPNGSGQGFLPLRNSPVGEVEGQVLGPGHLCT